MHFTRRSFLQVIAVSAATLDACSSDGDASPPGPSPLEGRSYFPQSVASGDPKPDSVVLWTRVIDPARGAGDLTLTLEVAKDARFAEPVVRTPGLVAPASHDSTVRVKVVGLSARTTYYYRFVYERGGERWGSQVGRTRTAPSASDESVVRFAVASCQDFVGRYYNAWQQLRNLDEDLDFVVFLGDYVYETTGDPSFMSLGGARVMTFSDPSSALPLGTPDASYFAANSVSNYRDLYRTVRSDENLQAIHERYPFVFVWDDHEYSDDSYRATSTYSDGRAAEDSPDRRRNAEQVYFEYIPLDPPTASVDGVIDVDLLPKYPDSRIFRDLAFGKNLRLVIADYRTYRPDHLIPEDAFPGTVIMDAPALAQANLTDAFTSEVFAYLDIDDPAYIVQKIFLTEAYKKLATDAGLTAEEAASRAPSVIRGALALVFVNAVLTNPALGLAPISAEGLPRGLAWLHMGKRDLFSSQGSRYVVVKDTFDAYAAYEYARSMGKSEDVLGPAQSAWFDAALANGERWKVMVSSVSLTSMIFDLREKTDVADTSLRNRYYLNADIWDGFPSGKRQVLAKLAKVAEGRALVVSGDIHASFASVESGDATLPGVVCLTAPAISSRSLKSETATLAKAGGFEEGSPIYRYLVSDLEASFAEANPAIAFSETDANGFMVVEISAESAKAVYHLIPSSEVATSYVGQDAALAAKVTSKTLLVSPGKLATS